MQTIVSRNVDPIQGGVVTFGSFHAGTTNNVIAETAEVYGTIRTLTQEMSLLIQKRVRQIAEGVAASFGLEVDIMLKQGGYLPVENNPALAKELMAFFDASPVKNKYPYAARYPFLLPAAYVQRILKWLGQGEKEQKSSIEVGAGRVYKGIRICKYP